MSDVAGVDLDEVLVWIDKYRVTYGFPPSRRDISERFSVGLESSQRILKRMIEEGLITVAPGVSRGINITGTGMKVVTENMT